MKKVLALLLGLLMLTCLFTACDGGDDVPEETQHKHSFETTWSADADGHWYAATCGCDTAKANAASHTDDDKDGICDICEYAGDHEHTYKEEWAHDDEKHWHDADCGHAVKSEEGSHTDTNNDGLCDGCAWNFDHEHTYKSDWSHDADNHWHEVTCSHTVDVKDKAPHADDDNDGICDGCQWDYDHAHTYEETWSYDTDNHWHQASCGHSVKADIAPHEDENNDAICDGCGWNFDHTHVYAQDDDWTINDTHHWHAPICGHDVAGVDEAEHADKNHDRVCDTCGYDFDHVHTYDTENWSYDKTSHYHAPTCGHSVRSDEAPHEDKDNNGECDVCLYNFGHAHTYDEAWSHDEDNHWHAPTCGHDIQGSDFGAHADANNDSICDGCGWDYDHTHTYDTSKWMIGVNTHYHAPTCGHNPVFVRGDEEEHIDKNRDDICDTCFGYVSMEVVVDNATDTNAANRVSSGVILEHRETATIHDYKSEIKYEFGTNGYLHMTENHSYHYFDENGKRYDTQNQYEHWYETYADGQKIFAISIDENAPVDENTGKKVPYRNLGIETMANMAGAYFSGDFISYGMLAYGVEDLLYQLYYLKDGDNGAGVRDFVEYYDNETKYYSFMFTYSGMNYGVYFKIDENFTIESLIITGTTGYADMNTTGKTYAITVTQKVGERIATNPYDPDDMLINSFVVKDPQGNVLKDGDQIDILAGADHRIELIIENVLPETADAKYDKIVAISTDSQVISYANMTSMKVTVNGQTEGVHDLVLSSDHVSITLKVKVTYPAPTEMGPMVYYGDGLTAGDSTENTKEYSMYLGDTIYFNAAVNEHANKLYNATLTSGDAGAVTMEATTIEVGGREVAVTSFTPGKTGTYTVTIASTVAPNLKATLTIVVSDKPSIEELLNGQWQAAFQGLGVMYDITFTPESEGATKGKVEIVDRTRASGMSPSTLTTIFSYEYFADGIQLTYISGDENDIKITLNEDYTMKIGNFELTRPAS